ncbi:MAG: hypothetical protein WC729_05350 [Sphingomonas sp.]|jgi:hypothetical protein|uniref:hypothetical protein n=1 Tax=Sphingomonas sp. TaxID=28214 RepID=UPI003561D478
MTTKAFLTASAAAVLAFSLSGCGTGETSGGGGAGVIRDEAYCSKSGLSAPLRQTFILIDANVVKKSEMASDFAERNLFLRDLGLAFANPALSLASGLSDPRERISIMLVPTDGSPAQLVFTGCIPGLSPDEEVAARAGASWVREFATGDALKGMAEDAEKFQINAIGGLTSAAKRGVDTPEPQTGSITGSALFSAIRASRGVLEPPKGTIARYVLVTNLSAVAFESSESSDSARKQGQDAGFKAGGDFGLSDVMIVQPEGAAPEGKDYLEGFLLAQGGRLVSYSSGKPMAGERAPKTVRYFEGEAAYPGRSERLKMRIADDGKGNLSSSWLTMLGGINKPIPLTGQISCSSPTICKITSDDKGFAQIWSPQPGGKPEFINEMPFAGMRNFNFEIRGKELKGEASDPMVQIGNDGSKSSIAITADIR